MQGKNVLVTGAASGIGRASAVLLASQGAVLLCTDLDEAGAEQVAGAITELGGEASAKRLDVTSESGWRAAIEVIDERGGLDVLVHSAGISAATPIADTSLDDWRRVLSINLDGAFLGTREAVVAMRRHGRGGSVVHVSSASGLKAAPGASAYCASKAGLGMLVKAVAKECIGDGIRVNAVCPAGVKTPLWRTMDFFHDLVEQTGSEEAAYSALAEGALHGRLAEPAEIAEAVLYLASDASSYVTGTELVIDGGFIA